MKYPETAKRLRMALDNKNMRPVDLANKAGMSEPSISQYLNGTNRPGNISAGKMANVLGVDPVWLMGFDVPAPFYTNEEASEIAQTLADRPELKLLLDASKDVSKEDIEQIIQLVKRFSK